MSAMRIRGVMMDLARVTERHEYYRALPRRLAGWGYNTLFAHFTDDEGCAMRFASRPELAGPHAFTPAQVRQWVRDAADAGVTIIPELESFGHTEFIHGLKKYAALREPTTGYFNALNPLARQSRAILRDLVLETADVFDPPFIHAGLDEVNFGASSQVRRALKTRRLWELFADHVNFMHELITATGKRMMMWGDHILHEPRIADRIPKDIVICDWHYQADVKRETVELFVRRGFDTIACPASNRSGDMILPNATTQINLQRFARIAHDVSRAGTAGSPVPGKGQVLGLMNTVWCPQRMLCGVEQFAMALGGAWFNDPAADPTAVVAEFLASQYGLSRPTGPAEALLRLSAINPGRNVLRRLLNSEQATTDAITTREAEQARELFEQAVRLGDLFIGQARLVKRNREEFGNYALAAELLAWAAMVGIIRAEAAPSAPGLRRTLLAEGRRLLRRCQADWNRGRYADDPKRDLDGTPGRWPDALIPNLHLALARLSGK